MEPRIQTSPPPQPPTSDPGHDPQQAQNYRRFAERARTFPVGEFGSHRDSIGFGSLAQDDMWRLERHAYPVRVVDERTRVENLRVFRELIGITTSKELTSEDGRSDSQSYLCFRKKSKNVGYYQRIINDELKATIWYSWATWATNILLAVQISIAATLTALGVLDQAGLGLAISVLAAINTAVATILTYLKAKGQPTRALQYRDQMRRLRERIEYTERVFELGIMGEGELDPARAATSIKRYYDAAQRQEEKKNAAAQASLQSAVTMASPVEQRGEGKNEAASSSNQASDAAARASAADHEVAARFA